MWQNRNWKHFALFKMLKNLPNNLPELDELDRMIIRELESDARVSYMALASKLGTSHTTMRKRFAKLVDREVVAIVAIPAYAALGYKTHVVLGFNAPEGALSVLAKQINAIDSIKYSWITAGRYDMVAMAWYRSPDDYFTSFPEEFGSIPKTVKIESMLSGKIIKSTRSYMTQKVFDANIDSGSCVTLSELDISIMKGLEKYPRIPVKDLARDIGASLPTVRSSLRRLTSEGIVRIVSAPDPAVFGYAVSGMTLIQVHPSSLEILTDRFKGLPSVKRMTLNFGVFNCIIWTSFQNSDQMSEFMIHDLGNMPGVLHYETLVFLKVHKRSFSLMNGNPCSMNDSQ